MRKYDSIIRIQDNGTLLGEQVWAFNKLDGQNFGVKYNPNQKAFTGFHSRKCLVDETSEAFGAAVQYFKTYLEEPLKEIIAQNRGKRQLFNGVKEIDFFFEWYGPNSFAGFHQEGDEMTLALIDLFLQKKGYIEPQPFYDLFCKDPRIPTPTLIYRGPLNQDFIKEIQENDWTKPECKYPEVKEGVVARRSTLMKGQRMPKVKIKTKWWLDKLHNTYPEEKWKELE